MSKTLLDDLEYIHTKDSSDALGIAQHQTEQLTQPFETIALYDTKKPSKIVWAGMGGSALAPSLVQSWLSINVPFEITKNYELPHYVSEDTLVICTSYSGNTEETLSALENAKQKNAQIIIMSTGGALQKIAEEENIVFIEIQKVAQPRFSTFSQIGILGLILSRLGVTDVDEKLVLDSLHEVSTGLEEVIKNWAADVPTSDNRAKQIALDIAGTSPVIYGGPLMFPAAYKWKISFNENAKNVSWCNVIPEFSHNEFLGWTSHPVDKPYSVIDLRSTFEHPRVQKRFEVTERLLSGKRPAPTVIEAQGDSVLEHLLYCVALGDFVSMYTALLNGLDPTPVDLIERMKKALDE